MTSRRPLALQPRLPSLHDAAVALLDRTIESLRRRADEEAVHSARKSCKRVRAALRLLREGLGECEYRRDSKRIRDSARPLTAVRDAVMLRQALAKLSKHAQSLQCDLEADYHRAWQYLTHRGVRTAVAQLRATRGRLLKAVFNARFRKLHRRAGQLADALADDHDLSVLSSKLRPGEGSERSLCKQIMKRRRKLQARAFRQGERLYRHSAKKLEATLVAHLSKAQRTGKSTKEREE